jgi:LysM repeat protein
MSLFGFVKEIGRNLFNKDEDAAKKIKEHILENNPGVSDLEVDFEDGFVGLAGVCESPDAFQKCVLMAGNVKGVIDVYTKGLRVAEGATQVAAPAAGGNQPSSEEQIEPADGPAVEYYTIERGDTLSKIAQQYYGKASAYPRIFEANREVIQDPDLIFPGQKIRIPMD